MKAIKRFLAVSLFALLVVSGVAACGQTTPVGGGGAPHYYQPSGGGGHSLR